MNTMAKTISAVLRFANPWWLTGPILDKELRVSSRRKRNYVLRVGYLLILASIFSMFWAGSATHHYSGAYQISRMVMMGREAVLVITWTQFCMMQFLAVVMLSNSISDEVYHKTLGTLMTTPITSLQVVMGKLLSKLWQLFVLLLISLPVLAVLRVFGGVPWEFVVASVCMTLSAVVFAAAVSMFFSIRSKRSYLVVTNTLAMGAFLYGVVPMCVALFCDDSTLRIQTFMLEVFVHSNPFAALAIYSEVMLSGRAIPMGMTFSPGLHCGVMLVAAGLILAWNTLTVRKVALRQATGQPTVFDQVRSKRNEKKAREGGTVTEVVDRIRRVTGPVMVWKELRRPLVKWKVSNVIAAIVTVGLLVWMYCFLGDHDAFDDGETHGVFAVVLMFIGIFLTTVHAATTITTEKESRSWPILMATPIGGWEIVFGKAIGVFKRVLPVWVFLIGHMVVFVFAGYLHWIVLVHMAMLITWSTLFVTGSGILFSSMCRKTTAAVIMNVAFVLVLWAGIPLLCGLIGAIGNDTDLLEAVAGLNPVIHAWVLVEGVGWLSPVEAEFVAESVTFSTTYHWPWCGYTSSDWSLAATMALTGACTVVYSAAGLVLAAMGVAGFRRDIF